MGSLGPLTNNPFDVAKTRLMNQQEVSCLCMHWRVHHMSLCGCHLQLCALSSSEGVSRSLRWGMRASTKTCFSASSTCSRTRVSWRSGRHSRVTTKTLDLSLAFIVLGRTVVSHLGNYQSSRHMPTKYATETCMCVCAPIGAGVSCASPEWRRAWASPSRSWKPSRSGSREQWPANNTRQ